MNLPILEVFDGIRAIVGSTAVTKSTNVPRRQRRPALRRVPPPCRLALRWKSGWPDSRQCKDDDLDKRKSNEEIYR